MHEPSIQPGPAEPKRRFGSADRRSGSAGGWLALATAALVMLMTWFIYFYYPGRIGPAQPIPFSHRLHANAKEISCLVCHPEAAQGPRAGMPSLETCMLCHERIIPTHPEIQKLHAQYARHVPVEWRRVYDLADYVFFDHSAHVRRQVDCGVCHGNVREIDRIVKVQEFQMGFCVQCHRDNQVSHDCTMCHR